MELVHHISSGKLLRRYEKTSSPVSPVDGRQQQNVNPDLFHDFLNNFAILAVESVFPKV